MKTGKTNKLLAAATIATLLGATAVRADDYAPVWQYEMGVGGQRPFHTFYLSYQSRDGGYVGPADFDRRPQMRIALYSTDPSMHTSAKQFSLLRRAADDENASVGEVFGTLAGVVLLFGLPAAATVKEFKDASQIKVDCVSDCESPKK